MSFLAQWASEVSPPFTPCKERLAGLCPVPCPKGWIQTGLSPRDLEPADQGLERSCSVLSTPRCLCSTLGKCQIKELLMGLTPFPYVTQTPGVWFPLPHSQLLFNWRQPEWGAGMFFFSGKHCPGWWNYTQALGQVSQQRQNLNMWHFKHSFVLPACCCLHLEAAV